MSLIAAAKQHGHDPHAYLKDVLTRPPTTATSTNCCHVVGSLPPDQIVPRLCNVRKPDAYFSAPQAE